MACASCEMQRREGEGDSVKAKEPHWGELVIKRREQSREDASCNTIYGENGVMVERRVLQRTGTQNGL